MYELHIPAIELYDEQKNMFVYIDECDIVLEHSLHSLYLWEQHYKKPFLSNNERTREESIYYVKCMVLTKDVPSTVYSGITDSMLNDIDKYVNDKLTATTITKHEKEGQAPKKKIITAEEIYQMMVALNIPFECQYWHLSSLMTLIEVCNERSKPPKKYSSKENAARYAKLNARRSKRKK